MTRLYGQKNNFEPIQMSSMLLQFVYNNYGSNCINYLLSYFILIHSITGESNSYNEYNEEEEEREVCNQASENMNEFNRSYGPYFPNFTATMLFFWVTKHMICAFYDVFYHLYVLHVLMLFFISNGSIQKSRANSST